MMNDHQRNGQAQAGSAGLCDRCAHVQIVTSARGSRFYLCRMSQVDSRFPKYPAIPVIACAGFTPAGANRSADS
jgi:hypothetical protein